MADPCFYVQYAYSFVIEGSFGPLKIKLSHILCHLLVAKAMAICRQFKGLLCLNQVARAHVATSHTRLRAREHCTSSTLIGGKGGAGPNSLHTALEGPTEYISECKMDVKVYMDSYMVSNGLCYMVIWIIFKNHLLEVGLTQNWETLALRTLTTVDLFYFIMCEDLHE